MPSSAARPVLAAIALGFVSPLAAGQSSAGGAAPEAPAAPAGPPAAETLAWSLNAVFTHQLDTDLDGGGEVSLTSFDIEPTLTWTIDDATSWSFSFGYGLDQYDFGGTGGLAGMYPWGDITHLSLGASIRRKLDDSWTLFGGPSLRIAAEDGADLDSGLTGGGFIGAGYRVNDRLTIGPGLGIFSEIEDDVEVFPVLIINWRIRDDLTLRTGSLTGATRGPGLELAWKLDDSLEVALATRYDSNRFRLDDAGPAPDGVGEDEGFALVGGVRWKPDANITLTVFGGVQLESQLTLYDRDGVELMQEDSDPQPVIGLAGSIRF